MEMNEKRSQGDDLYNILYTLFKRKYLAMAIFIATFAGIIFGTYLVTPLWKATAKVRVQYNPKPQLAMVEDLTTPGALVLSVNPANDVIQMLTSRELAEEIAKRFERDKLWQKRVHEPEQTREIIRWHIFDFLVGTPIRFLQYLGVLTQQPHNYIAMAVEELEEDLEDIELEEDTTVVNVAIWGESPEIATDMSNTLVQLLLEKNLGSSRLPMNQIIDSTQREVAQSEIDLENAQEDLRRFKEESGLVSYDEETKILLQRLDRYEEKLIEMKDQLISFRIEKKPDHPDVRILTAAIDEYRNVIIPAIRSKLMALPLKEVELAKLTQDLMIQVNLYGTLRQRLLDLQFLKNSSMGDLELKVIDTARVYSYVKPDWPRWVINIPLGFIGSIATGLVFIFFVEYWNRSFKSVKELEESIPIRVRGAIPKFTFWGKKRLFRSLRISNTGSDQSHLPIKLTTQRNLQSLAHYDLAAEAMLIEDGTPADKLFLITSPAQGEGKSITTLILGQKFSTRGKKVLLVEADLRNPSLERMLNVKGNKGLYEYYIGSSGLQEVLVGINGIDIIFAGNPPTRHVDPFEMLASDNIEALLQHARREYDFIFLDSPSIKGFKDALILTTISDAVILVVAANETPRRAILMANQKINAVGGEIKGIILNKQINYVPGLVQNFLDSF